MSALDSPKMRRYEFKDHHDAMGFYTTLRMEYGLDPRKEQSTLTVDVADLNEDQIHELDDLAVEICASNDADAVQISELTLPESVVSKRDPGATPVKAGESRVLLESQSLDARIVNNLGYGSRESAKQIHERLMRDLKYIRDPKLLEQAMHATLRRMALTQAVKQEVLKIFQESIIASQSGSTLYGLKSGTTVRVSQSSNPGPSDLVEHTLKHDLVLGDDDVITRPGKDESAGSGKDGKYVFKRGQWYIHANAGSVQSMRAR